MQAPTLNLNAAEEDFIQDFQVLESSGSHGKQGNDDGSNAEEEVDEEEDGDDRHEEEDNVCKFQVLLQYSNCSIHCQACGWRCDFKFQVETEEEEWKLQQSPCLGF